MTNRHMTILLSGAIGLCLSGCAATTPTMRGQSPNAAFTGYANEMAHGAPCGQTCNDGFASQCMPAGCQPGMCEYGGPCQAQCGCDRCLNLPFHPVHRNFHTYDVPKNLSYPAENAAPASIQYPYYTTRGPTDFFMK